MPENAPSDCNHTCLARLPSPLLAHSPNSQVRRQDVLSTWSGIRPLASDPTKSAGAGDTSSIVREHVIFTDKDGMVTVSVITEVPVLPRKCFSYTRWRSCLLALCCRWAGGWQSLRQLHLLLRCSKFYCSLPGDRRQVDHVPQEGRGRGGCARSGRRPAFHLHTTHITHNTLQRPR